MASSDGDTGTSMLRYVHEYLCSLNLAWALVWVVRTTDKTWSNSSVANLCSPLVRGLQQFVSPIGGRTVLDQLVWSFVISVIGFCFFRVVSGFRLSHFTLRVFAGGMAVVAFPLAKGSFVIGRYSNAHPIEGIGLALEIVFVLICGGLFLLKNRLISSLQLSALLLVHFALWAGVTSSYIDVFSFVTDIRASAYYHPWGRALGTLAIAIVFNFGFPVIGFLASLSWMRYLDSSFPQSCKTAVGTVASVPGEI
jgi:hypothetical protein